MAVPYTFANRTSSIPLSDLDSNFSTPVTLGSTSVQLGNTAASVSDLGLANVSITSGTAVLSSANATTADFATANITTANITNLNITLFTPSNVSTTNITYTGTLTGGNGVINIDTGKIYKKADGNVGFSTTNPAAIVDVNGNALINGMTVGRGGNTSTSTNLSVGAAALANVTTGIRNNAIGSNALTAHTTGDNNVAIGVDAMATNNNGSGNIAIGRQALNKNVSGSFSVGIGPLALFNATGGNNIGIGNNTGLGITGGSNNALVGAGSTVSAGAAVYQYVFGTSLTAKGDNTAYIGGSSGAYNQKNVTTWETTSDRRIKRNIEDNHQGLAVIERIRVRNFEYRLPDEIDSELPRSAAIDKPGVQIGVIAQEMQEVLPECVTANSTGVLSVNTDPLVWHLINAVKQLSARVAELEAKQ